MDIKLDFVDGCEFREPEQAAATDRAILNKEQLKAKFRREGRTVAQWAKDNGYEPNRVYRVIGGFDKAYHGKAHDIAVKLGLKDGVIREEAEA